MDGGFSLIEETRQTSRQGQTAMTHCTDSLLIAAFDVAIDAKNSLAGSLMVVNRLPLVLM